MHPGLAALLAALASAEVVVVRPIAAPVAPLGVVGAPLAAAAKVHAPSALQLAVPAVQPVRPGGAGRSVVTTLGLARDAARRIRPLAGATLGTAGELARTFDGSEPLASAPPEPRDLSTVRSLRFGTYNMLNLFEKVGKHVLDPDRPGRLKRISDPVAKEEWQLQEQAKAILDNDLD
ncbi:MAG: hypothetical protein HY553_17215, partial [Elusimicrobia bacterium]|nr:hypothetical protein [Elusimicrobiota bacterium]